MSHQHSFEKYLLDHAGYFTTDHHYPDEVYILLSRFFRIYGFFIEQSESEYDRAISFEIYKNTTFMGYVTVWLEIPYWMHNRSGSKIPEIVFTPAIKFTENDIFLLETKYGYESFLKIFCLSFSNNTAMFEGERTIFTTLDDILKLECMQ